MSNGNEALVAHTLEDAVLFRIAEFLDPVETAVVCKSFFEAATKTSVSALKCIERNHGVDPKWKLRLARHMLDSYERFYFGTADDTAAANQHPTLHPRLLYRSALTVPLMHRGELYNIYKYIIILCGSERGLVAPNLQSTNAALFVLPAPHTNSRAPQWTKCHFTQRDCHGVQ